MLNKQDYWPYFIGVLVLGGGILLPTILQLMQIPHKGDYDGSVLMGLMLSAPFLFAINRQDCSINFGRLIIAYLVINYLALKIFLQTGDFLLLLPPGIGGIILFYLGGWLGIRIGYLFGYSKPPETIEKTDSIKGKVYLGVGIFISTLVFYVLYFGASEPAPTAEERSAMVMNMKKFIPGTAETLSFIDGRYEFVMQTIPGGQFEMGSTNGSENELPVHPVIIHPFKLSKFEITADQWAHCAMDLSGGCEHTRNSALSQRRGTYHLGSRPVEVTHDEVTKQYIPYLNRLLGTSFRLPTEAEWEYSARAGSTTNYSWGDEITRAQAAYYEGRGAGLAPVDSYQENVFGLHNMHGNAAEWVQDCWHPSYKTSFTQAPHDGSVWTSILCVSHVRRGGSVGSSKNYVRSSSRSEGSGNARSGFRLAHDID